MLISYIQIRGIEITTEYHMNEKNNSIYGSFWLTLPEKKQKLLSSVWLFPHNIRRFFFRKFFKKEYWYILNARQELERSFKHPENDYIYSIKGFHKTKSIFVHIPKCGGISVANSIFSHTVPHSSLTDYQIMFGKEIFETYFKFTLVRNPWSRIVSSYTFLKNGGFDQRDNLWTKENINNFESFEEFIIQLPNNKILLNWIHFMPQHKWILSPTGKNHFDHIGKLENIDDELRFLCDRLGLKYINNIILNSSNNTKYYKELYSSKTRSIVEEIYYKDIKLLGYKF